MNMYRLGFGAVCAIIATVLGVVIVALVLFLPNGLLPMLRSLWAKRGSAA